MIEIKLCDRDEKIINMHSELFPFTEYSFSGGNWVVNSTEDFEDFATYKEFIEYIEDDVKESLLVYALNGELAELAESWEL